MESENTRTVLILEKSTVFSRLLQTQLSELGLSKFIFCRNPTEALEEVRVAARGGRVIDLILSEMRFDATSGIDFLKTLRLPPYSSRSPFIFVTSEMDPALKALGRKWGAQAVLTKPFAKEDLQHLVKQIFSMDPAKLLAKLDFRGAESESRQRRVLIVSPLAEFRSQLTASIMARLPNCSILSVKNALEALVASLESPFDLIVLSEDLEQMTGKTLSVKLRTQYQTSKTPIVLLAGGKHDPRIAVLENVYALSLSSGMETITDAICKKVSERVTEDLIAAEESDLQVCSLVETSLSRTLKSFDFAVATEKLQAAEMGTRMASAVYEMSLVLPFRQLSKHWTLLLRWRQSDFLALASKLLMEPQMSVDNSNLRSVSELGFLILNDMTANEVSISPDRGYCQIVNGGGGTIYFPDQRALYQGELAVDDRVVHVELHLSERRD
ncbi:MAG: hypothetical protein RJB38_1951 [Pseudomonadota bacterium]